MLVDIKRWAMTIRIAFYAFLVTAWFLSRTYNMTFYVLVGMVASLTAISFKETKSAKLLPRWSWTLTTVAAEFASILLIYVTLKLRSMV
jgi:hypothetical protein